MSMRYWPAGLLVAATIGACNTSTGLPAAAVANTVDTVTLSAITGTPLTAPSAYSLSLKQPVRTDQVPAFDFAFEITSAGAPIFLPLGALELVTVALSPGFIPQQVAFDSIMVAPLNGYLTKDTMPATLGARYIVRSRLVCSGISAALYGKLEVLAVDDSARTATLRILVNGNCGYRGLQPGVPLQ